MFQSDEMETQALNGIDLATEHGEFVSLVGFSGCGKTTLLRTIAGLIRPSSGEIEFASHPDDRNSDRLLVFQESSLFPWMRVLENATFGLSMRGVERQQREREAVRLLEQFGLAGRERSWPADLSLGMRQRVALVRAFLCKPALLLMDEPFAALDAQTRLALQRELLQWRDPHPMSVIFVTHDVDEAILLSDRVLIMARTGGHIESELRIPFGRPRDAEALITPEFLSLKRTVLERMATLRPRAVHA